MRGPSNRQKAIRIVRYTLIVALIGGTAACMTLWLIFQHKPAWYRPAPTDPDTLRDIRMKVTEIADGISRRIVAGEAFELSFADDTITRWLAALPHVWPDAARAVPKQLSEHVIRFEPGAVRIGTLYVEGGWRAVLSAAVEIGVSDDNREITLKLREAHGGSLPIPSAILHRVLARLDAGRERSRSRKRGSGLDDPTALLEGTAVPNRFVWPNGRRPFRITELELTKGRIRLRIEPL